MLPTRSRIVALALAIPPALTPTSNSPAAGWKEDYRLASSVGDQATPLDRALDRELYSEAIRLARQWVRETTNLSSPNQMKATPSFSSLIALSNDAIPGVLHAYRTEASYLFIVLQTITGVNPVPREHYGDLEAIRRAWLRWGQEHVPDPR